MKKINLEKCHCGSTRSLEEWVCIFCEESPNEDCTLCGNTRKMDVIVCDSPKCVTNEE